MKPLKIGNLTVKVPIIQGGMGVAISLSGLASAVANEGGIGVISTVGIGMTEPNYIKNSRNAAQGKMEEGFVFAGTNAYLTDKLQSVANVFDELISEYNIVKKITIRNSLII